MSSLSARTLLPGLVLTAVLVGCGGDPPDRPAPAGSVASATAPSLPPTQTKSAEPTAAPSHGGPPRVRHVVVVSLDGLGTNVIGEVGLGRMPNLARLLAEGAGTLNARTAVELTVTLPNHAGMLTGRPIDASSGGHGVTLNGDTTQTVQSLAGGPIESVFDVVHAAGRSTALFATEGKFAIFERSWPEAIDRFSAVQDEDGAVLDLAVDDLLTEKRAFTFIHLGLVDEVGHSSGWSSSGQLDAAVEVDALLGDLVEEISADRRLARRLVLVVTADHGGVGRAHGDAADPRNFTVPFVVWGAGVDPGADLYDLNPQLVAPGDSQPGYDGPPPLRNGCVADLVTALLRLPPVDGSSLCTHGLKLARS